MHCPIPFFYFTRLSCEMLAVPTSSSGHRPILLYCRERGDIRKGLAGKRCVPTWCACWPAAKEKRSGLGMETDMAVKRWEHKKIPRTTKVPSLTILLFVSSVGVRSDGAKSFTQ